MLVSGSVKYMDDSGTVDGGNPGATWAHLGCTTTLEIPGQTAYLTATTGDGFLPLAVSWKNYHDWSPLVWIRPAMKPLILGGVALGGSWLISHKIWIFLPHTKLPTFLKMPRVREILIINPINTLYHVGIYWVYQYIHLQRAPTGGGKRSRTIPRGSWHDRTKATEIFQQLNKARTVRWTLA